MKQIVLRVVKTEFVRNGLRRESRVFILDLSNNAYARLCRVKNFRVADNFNYAKSGSHTSPGTNSSAIYTCFAGIFESVETARRGLEPSQISRVKYGRENNQVKKSVG